MSEARRMLDRVHSLAQLEELTSAPARFAAALADALPVGDSLEALRSGDEALTTALADIDSFGSRAMKLRLAAALADDTSLAVATRNVFVATVTSYSGRLDVLEQRVRDLAARGGAARPDDVADRIVEAARHVLALRDELRAGVLALVRERALAAIPVVDGRARNRALDEPERKRWSALRRDLELLADDPARIQAAPMMDRVAAWPEQLDEPASEPERSFADFIELD